LFLQDQNLAEELTHKSTENYVNESHSVYEVLTNRNQRFAYINTFDTFYLHAVSLGMSDHTICRRMSMVSGGVNRNKCGMMLPKGSSLKEPFNVK
jgi:hypothetical protein